MGRFVITRSAAGDSFCLYAENGRALARSHDYATLDACKKGIASLIVNAPVISVVDATAGERGPNPKFEIVKVGEGVGFVLKSANGKSVVASPTYATKKACLRAISMLRTGVCDYEIYFMRRATAEPLQMKHPAGAAVRPSAVWQQGGVMLNCDCEPVNLPEAEMEELAAEEVAAAESEATAAPATDGAAQAAQTPAAAPADAVGAETLFVAANTSGEGKTTPPPAPDTVKAEAADTRGEAPPAVPRLVRLHADPPTESPKRPPVSTPPTKKRGFLQNLFKK